MYIHIHLLIYLSICALYFLLGSRYSGWLYFLLYFLPSTSYQLVLGQPVRVLILVSASTTAISISQYYCHQYQLVPGVLHAICQVLYST